MSASTIRKISSELPVAGIIPFSATDWPGHLTLTVFTQGCPLRCVYCHNPTLQAFRPGKHHFSEALSLASERRTLLDALVISGGEPTASLGLANAIRQAHLADFPVGLHTCGYRPSAIATLLADPLTTPDWVGLDVKALPEHMTAVTGCRPRIAKTVWDSLWLLTSAGVELQVRTTLWRGSVIEQHLTELQARVAAFGHKMVVQQARGADGQPFVTDAVSQSNGIP